MENLTILIMTFKLNQEIKSSKYLPKVCHKIGDKTMIEIVLETALKINPKNIILYVSKNNVQCINKVLKHTYYAKYISYCILDNELNGEQKLSLAHNCYESENVLVIPGNAPLLNSRTLYRIIAENKDIKILDNLFYLKKENLNIIDIMPNLPNVGFDIPKQELRLVETKSDLEDIQKLFEDKKN
jgi:bifunctional N-acetylglucosamine-1-phosphate-uridyltransferase/glucosamine-1-phosphate-acetyltransferase GlmU-like protein